MSDFKQSNPIHSTQANYDELPSVRFVESQSPTLLIKQNELHPSTTANSFKREDSHSHFQNKSADSLLSLNLGVSDLSGKNLIDKSDRLDILKATKSPIRRTDNRGYLKLGDIVLICVRQTFGESESVYKGFLSSDGVTNPSVYVIPRDSEIERGASSILRSCLFKIEQARLPSRDSKDFESDQAYNVGKLLTFGERVMFRHIHSNGLLRMNDKGLASENGCLQLHISTGNTDESAWFTIEHMGITKEAGDPIKYSDEVRIKSTYRGSSYFIHFLQKIRTFDDKLECNLYGAPNQIHLRCYMSYQDLEEDTSVLYTNKAFRIYHKTSNSYLTLTQISIISSKSTPELFLEINQKNNANNLWELQSQATFVGGVTEVESCYRIIHVVTGYYLREIMTKSGSPILTITSDSKAEGTLFKFYIDPDTPYEKITFRMLYKIQTESGNCLEIDDNTEGYSDAYSNNEQSKSKLIKLQKSSNYHAKFSFCIKDAHTTKVHHIYQICSSIPNFLDFIEYLNYVSNECLDFKNDERVSRQMIEECNIFMRVLKCFLRETLLKGLKEVSKDRRQSSIREIGVLEGLMDISMLVTSLITDEDILVENSFIWKTFDINEESKTQATKKLREIRDKIYVLVYQIIRDNVKNNAVMAKYREYLLDQLRYHTESVGNIIRELYNFFALKQSDDSKAMVKNIWKELEPISERNQNIDRQINYIQIISTLCEFDEMANGCNQRYIVDELSRPKRNFYILRFDMINGKPAIEFHLPEGVNLEEFLYRNPTLKKMQIVKDKELLLEDERPIYYVGDLSLHNEVVKYISSVIDLFCEICREREQKGIKFVTEMLNADVNHIIAVLYDSNIDSRIRDKYAKLLKVAYVDVEPQLSQVLNPYNVYIWNTDSISEISFPIISASYYYDILQLVYKFWGYQGMIQIHADDSLVGDIQLTTRFLRLTYDLIDLNIDTSKLTNVIIEPLRIIIMKKLNLTKHWCKELMINLSRKKMTKEANLYDAAEFSMLHAALSILELILKIKKKDTVKELLGLFKVHYDMGDFEFEEDQYLIEEMNDIVSKLDFKMEYSKLDDQALLFAARLAKLHTQDNDYSAHTVNERLKQSFQLDIYLLEHIFEYDKDIDKRLKTKSLNLLIQIFNIRKSLKLDLKDVELLTEPISTNAFYRMVELKRELHFRMRAITMFQNDKDIINQGVMQDIEAACTIIFEFMELMSFEMKDKYKVSKYQNLARHAKIHEELISVLYLSPDNKIYERLFQLTIDALYLFCFRKFKNQSILAEHKERLIDLIGICLGITRILSMALSKSINKKSDNYVSNVIKMIISSIKLTNLKPELLQVLRTLLLDEQMRVVPKLQIVVLKGLLNNKAIISLNSEKAGSMMNLIEPILDIKDIDMPGTDEKTSCYLESLKPDHLLNFHIELMKTINACAYRNRFSILQCRKLVSYKNLFERFLDDNEATKLSILQKKVYLRFMYLVFMLEGDNIQSEFTINVLEDIIEKVSVEIHHKKYDFDTISKLARKNLYENIKPINSNSLNQESDIKLGLFTLEGNSMSIYENLTQKQQDVLDSFNYLSGDKSWHTEKDGLLHVLADIFSHNKYKITEAIKQRIILLMNSLEEFNHRIIDIEDHYQDLDFSNLILVVNSCRAAIPTILYETIEKTEDISNSEQFQACGHVIKLLINFIISEKMHIEECYKIFDTDRDGFISLEEFKKTIRSILGSSILQNEIEDAFNEIDKDGDGGIEYKEFREIARKYIIKEDTARAVTMKSDLKFATTEFIHDYRPDELDDEREILRSLKNFNLSLDHHCKETDINILVEKVRRKITNKDLKSQESLYLSRMITNLEKVFKKRENRLYILKILNLIIPQIPHAEDLTSIHDELPRNQLEFIIKIQNLYIKSGVHITALDIIYEDTKDELNYEAFKLLEAMVRYGNLQAQNAILSELKNTSDPFIFSYMRNGIRACRDRIVERVKRSYSKSQILTSGLHQQGEAYHNSKRFGLSQKERARYEFVQTVLNFIIGCCEGCNSGFQNYFRDQGDGFKKNKLSINLVAELAKFLINIKEVGANLSNDIEAVNIIPKVLLALVSLCRGPCAENQRLLGMKQNLYHFLSLYFEMNRDELEIRYFILILESLLEGDVQQPIAECMLEEIDFEDLSKLSFDIYTKYIHNNIRDIIQDKVQGTSTDSTLLKFMNFVSGGVKFENAGLSIEHYAWVKLGFSIILIAVKLRDAFPNDENLRYFKFSEGWGYKDSNFEIIKRIDHLGGRQESLLTDIWIVLQNVLYATKTRIFNYKETVKMNDALEFYLSLICSVEIDLNGKLVKHYFYAPRILAYSSERINWEIMQSLNRNSHEEKIKSFYHRSKKQQIYLEHLQFLSRFRILSWWAEKWNDLANINYFLVVLSNMIILFSTENKSESYITINGTDLTVVLTAIGILNVVLSISIYIFYILENYRIIIYDKVTKGNRARSVSWEMLKELQGTILLKKYKEMIESNTSINKMSRFLQMPYIILDSYNVYNLLYVAISLIALNQPYFYCILLLDILRRNETLRDILKAITLNWKALVLTGILATVIIFGLGILAFLYLGEYYATQEEGADMNTYCYSLWECFSSSFSNGLRAGGGIGEVLLGPTRDENDYGLRQAFDLVFFMFIIIVLLNIIFGIIIDNFASLRDIRKKILEDMETVCMICGREKHELEGRGSGWLEHISIDHNMWSYMGFIFYVRKLPTHLCNGLEKYVKQKIKQQDVSFFPKTTKSLELFDEGEEDIDNGEINQAMQAVFDAIENTSKRLQTKSNILSKQ